MLVSWVTIGTWRAGNHSGSTRSTEMNTPASPSPTSARAVKTAAMSVDSASRVCPAAIRVMPTTRTRRAPKRSSARPAGICPAAYTPICSAANPPSSPALTANRSAASGATAPRLDRLHTATM